MKRTKKTRPALWRSAFPEQAARLRPEYSKAGGIKARSVPEAVRMEVYKPIAALYVASKEWCECCQAKLPHWIWSRPTQNHHKNGRVGLLLFDVRYFTAVCDRCHRWIGDNPKEAEALGMILKR